MQETKQEEILEEVTEETVEEAAEEIVEETVENGEAEDVVEEVSEEDEKEAAEAGESEEKKGFFKKKKDKKDEKIDELTDQVKRQMAEFENFRKRSDREKAQMFSMGEQNVLEKIRLLQALPVAVHDDRDDSRDFVWFYIKGRMVDYIIDTEKQMKVSGSTSPASFVEYWKFTRRENNWVLSQILQKNEAEQIPFSE